MGAPKLTYLNNPFLKVEKTPDLKVVYRHKRTSQIGEYYFPYGMQMEGRKGNSGEYRYGFQGQEKDDEVSGEGNSYSADYWQYDSRLGRRWNLDPVVKVHESPYASYANNPIWFVDPNGADTSQLNKNGKEFFNQVFDFIDNSISSYESKIKAREKMYKDKGWGGVENDSQIAEYKNRINNLNAIKDKMSSIANSASLIDNTLTLANVAYNEAGNVSLRAQLVIASAFMNNINYEPGDQIDDPSPSNISHYVNILDRFSSFSSADKESFLNTFTGSYNAARTSYTMRNLFDADYSNGATHWVSPKSLGTSKKAGYYMRNYHGLKVAFPNWARSNNWIKEHANSSKIGLYTDDVNSYKEFTVKGISAVDFTFYKGIKR